MRKVLAGLIFATLLPVVTAYAAQLSTPIPTMIVDGKKCVLLPDGGVQCPGEGPKCTAPCQSKISVKDDRAACTSASMC